MEEETVTIYVEEEGKWHYALEEQPRWPVDIDRQRLIRPGSTRISRSRTNIRRAISGVTVYRESPRQDTLSVPRRVPKTRGDTNEFIRAFWVNGKPKCRKGYTYDFKRKMCRRL
jgi:hypothetical protein